MNYELRLRAFQPSNITWTAKIYATSDQEAVRKAFEYVKMDGIAFNAKKIDLYREDEILLKTFSPVIMWHTNEFDPYSNVPRDQT